MGNKGVLDMFLFLTVSVITFLILLIAWLAVLITGGIELYLFLTGQPTTQPVIVYLIVAVLVSVLAGKLSKTEYVISRRKQAEEMAAKEEAKQKGNGK